MKVPDRIRVFSWIVTPWPHFRCWILFVSPVFGNEVVKRLVVVCTLKVGHWARRDSNCTTKCSENARKDPALAPLDWLKVYHVLVDNWETAGPFPGCSKSQLGQLFSAGKHRHSTPSNSHVHWPWLCIWLSIWLRPSPTEHVICNLTRSSEPQSHRSVSLSMISRQEACTLRAYLIRESPCHANWIREVLDRHGVAAWGLLT